MLSEVAHRLIGCDVCLYEIMKERKGSEIKYSTVFGYILYYLVVRKICTILYYFEVFFF